MRSPIVLALAAAFAAGTWYLGWWAVPLLAAAAAAAGVATPSVAAISALFAWGGLLATVRPMDTARLLSGVLKLPAPAIVLLTLAFGAMLAASAAAVAERPRARR